MLRVHIAQHCSQKPGIRDEPFRYALHGKHQPEINDPAADGAQGAAQQVGRVLESDELLLERLGEDKSDEHAERAEIIVAGAVEEAGHG